MELRDIELRDIESGGVVGIPVKNKVDAKVFGKCKSLSNVPSVQLRKPNLVKVPKRGWSNSVRDVLCDMKMILFDKEACVVFVVCFVTAVLSMAWAQYQRVTWETYAYPGYLLWIMITRIGDAYLCYYPWKMCCPNILKTDESKRIATIVVALVVVSEFVFLTGPPNKKLWEVPGSTTWLFKALVTLHFMFYFAMLFLLPYAMMASVCHHEAQVMDEAKIVNTAVEGIGRLQKQPSRLDTMIELSMDKSQSPGAIVVALIVLSYSFFAITLPYYFGISIFALGPLIFVPVLVLLLSDARNTISRHRGYCMLLSIFQLGIHALPSFMINTLFKETTSKATIIATFGYYLLMAGYGNQWRIIALNGTSSRDHIILLVLFQVFDVIFSNMAFVSVQEFDAVYFFLLFMTFGRVFIRESKIANDFAFQLFNMKGTPTSMAELQCTRFLRARQNIMLEVCSSLLLPSLFAIDKLTGWHILVRERSTYKSLAFLFQSSMALLITRFIAGSLAWGFLKHQAARIYKMLQFQKAIQVLPDINSTKKQIAKPSIPEKFNLLNPEKFQSCLREYWQNHLLYICACASYGIFNAIVFIGKINGDLDAKQS